MKQYNTLRKKKCVRRKNWKPNQGIQKSEINSIIVVENSDGISNYIKNYNVTHDDSTATDWQLIGDLVEIQYPIMKKITDENKDVTPTNINRLVNEFKHAAAYVDDITITRLLHDVGDEIANINKDGTLLPIPNMCERSKTANDWLCKEDHDKETIYKTHIQIVAHALAAAVTLK